MKIVLLLFVSASRLASAQSPFVADHDSNNWRFGVIGALDVNLHTAAFDTLVGAPSCCLGYQSGSGTGPSFGVLIEKPFTTNLLFDVRASFMSSNAVLTREEGTQINVDGVVTSGTFRHTLDARLSSIGLEPVIMSRLFGGLSLELGARAAFVMTKTFSQNETIITPVDKGVFMPENTRTRNVYDSRAIPNAENIGVWIMGGLRYELPLNAAHTLLLAPEVMYMYAFTPVVSGLNWHANTLRAGLSFIYAPATPEPKLETPAPPLVVPPPPPIVEIKPPAEITPLPKPALSATLAASGVETDGTESSVFTIRVEEFISTAMKPLLPFVFFDANASAMPTRYTTLTASTHDAFQIDRLFGMETLPVYHHLLDIVGRRLTDDPNASITLTGCNSDRGTEKGNRTLSQQRAESVRNYLHTVWNIADNRMKIIVRDLPTNPSNPDSSYGIEENQRVEISSDTRSILSPVISNDTLVTANPPVIRFRSTVQSQAGVLHWALNAAQQARHLKLFEGTGATTPIVDWNINDDKASIPRAPIPLDSKLDVFDSAGQHITTLASPLPVTQVTLLHKRQTRVADHTVDKYSLILFDFDKADVSASNKQLCKIIREHIEPASTVRVDGFSDRSGDVTRNLELSQSRADNIAHLISGGTIVSTGQRNVLYSSETPEGRCYCRTVTVTVETPVK